MQFADQRGVSNEAVVALRDVDVVYASGPPWARVRTAAVRHLDLQVREGETVGLVGESGSGKTTVGRVALGLLRPVSGTVLFEGRPIHEAKSRLRGKVQVVLQHPEWSLNPLLRVGTSVAEPLAVARVGTRQDRLRRVGELFEQVGLEPSLALRFPHELSGGQRQRASIARALITEPRLVVFDEVVSALDVSVQAQVLNLIRSTQQEHQYAAVFISHQLAAVRYVAHRVAVMYGGEIVAAANSEAYYRRPHHPYALALLADALLTKGEALEGLRPSLDKPAAGCPLSNRCPYAIDRCHVEKPELRAVGEELTACHRAEEL